MRILGIDVGSTSIKAVEFESSFGRFELQEYHEQKIQPVESGLLDAVQSLYRGLPKQPDKVVVSLARRASTFRNLQFPTKDRKTIQSSIAFEIEDEVPFAEEERIDDFVILSQNASGSLVHIASTLKSRVTETLDFWKGLNVDPDLVTTDTWVYRALINATANGLPNDGPVLLLDLGHPSTHLYIQYRNFPVTSREIFVGGKEMTLAICKKYQIPYEQAEAAKLDHGFIIAPSRRSQATPEQIAFSDALSLPVSELFKEVKRALLYAKGNTGQSVHRIFLTGQTALMPGIAALFEEEFKLPTRILPSLSGLGSSGVTYSESSNVTFAYAAGLGLLLAAPEKSGNIQYRRGPYSKQGASSTFQFRELKKPLLGLGVVFASILVSSLVQFGVFQSQQKELNKQLNTSIKSFFPGVSESASRGYLTDTKKLKIAVDKELKKARDLAKLGDPNPESPMLFLKDLSGSISKATITDLVKFEVGASPTAPYAPNDPKTVNLTFTTSTPQIMDQISSILEKKLSDFQKSKVDEVVLTVGTGTEKKLQCTFTGKPLDRSYAR